MSLAEELSKVVYLDAPGKAALYNSLLDAGYSDAQIRAQADQMFGDQSAYWSQLTSLAQSLRPQGLFATQQERPKAVLFGDSMSEYVGYKPDGTPDTKYGNSIADVIGSNLGIQVQNLATGGETSNEALAGGSKFGAFADYITQNRPEYAIIRYGAADAIKNQDPNVTLQSVQQMVDIARANGVTPIIVGVSELYGAQNSKTGNIAGYIDPGAEQRAAQINQGLAQIAANNGVAFTDVRSAVSAGQGDLLDGVHTNADFGKKMADAISESIVNVIPEAKVPQLPPNVDSLSATEKGRLYNDLIAQGYTDAQIRTAAKAESDQDWNALKQIAADVRDTTPEQVERQAQFAAAPGGLMSQGTGMVNPQLPAQFANLTPEQRTQMLMAATEGLDIPMSQAQVPLGQVGNTFYTLTRDGIIAGTPDPSGVGAQQQIYDANNQLLENAFLPRFGASNPVTNAFVGGTLGLTLGPAVLGLSAPTAAAIAAGAPRLNETGNLTEAAKAAALAGLTAYGAQSLFGGAGAAPSSIADDFIAADVAQLAAQGIPEEQIADILMRSGVSAQTAAAVLDAQFGTSAPGAARGLGDFSSTTPNTVNVTGTSLFNPAAAIAPSLGGAISNLPSTAPSPNRVEVPGSRLPTENLTVDDLLAVLSPAITGALPPITGGTTQQVGVTGSREPPASTTPSSVGGAAGSALGGIVPGVQPAIPTAPERVEVPGKREPGGGTLPAIVGATLPTIPSTVTQPLPEVAKPPAAKEESLFSPSDILKLLTLLGGGAAAGSMGGGGGGTVGGLPPSDTLIGSTTPQFGSDYYAAVQRYYNAFMPETPRNVAGPLQQWYENKFGA